MAKEKENRVGDDQYLHNINKILFGKNKVRIGGVVERFWEDKGLNLA